MSKFKRSVVLLAAYDAEGDNPEAADMLRACAATMPDDESDFSKQTAGDGVIPHQRVWDILRCVRHHLKDERLITLREYAWLVAEAPGATGEGSPAPRRLEAYDAVIRKAEDLKARLGMLVQKWKTEASAGEMDSALHVAADDLEQTLASRPKDLVWLTRDELKAHCAKVQAVIDACALDAQGKQTMSYEERSREVACKLEDALAELGHG